MRRHSRQFKRKEKPLEIVTDDDCSGPGPGPGPIPQVSFQQQQQQQPLPPFQQQLQQMEQMQQMHQMQSHQPPALESIQPKRDLGAMRRFDHFGSIMTPVAKPRNSPDRDMWGYNANFNDDNYEGPTQLQHSSGMSTQRDDFEDSSTQSVQTQVMSNEPDPTQPMKLDREDTPDVVMKDGGGYINGLDDVPQNKDKRDNILDGDESRDEKMTSKNSKSNGSEIKNDKNESEKRVDYGTLVWEKDNPEIIILNEESSIGRSQGCTVKIESSRISKVHCTLKYDNLTKKTYITDLSSNGTFVNNVRLTRSQKKTLNTNDVISLAYPSVAMFRFLSHSDEQSEFTKKYALTSAAPLGKGGSSVVRECRDRETGKIYAAKIIKKNSFGISEKVIEGFKREVDILSKLNHINIVKYIDLVDDPTELYIVLELVPGGSLLDRLDCGLLPEPISKDIFKQLLDGVSYLHSNGIVHRDLKPANVLLLEDPKRGSPIIKIADFGVARRQIDGNFMTTICGTFNYAAPEVLLQGNTFLGSGAQAAPYGKEVDMWSLGVILYCMLSGVHPFREEQGLPPLFDQITKGMYDFEAEAWRNVSPNAIDLIKRLLTVNTKDRITAKQGLLHKWFQEGNGRLNQIINNANKTSDNGDKESLSEQTPFLTKTPLRNSVMKRSAEKTEYSVKTPRRKVRQSPRGIRLSFVGNKRRFKWNGNGNDEDDDDDDEIVEEDDSDNEGRGSSNNNNNNSGGIIKVNSIEDDDAIQEIQDSGNNISPPASSRMRMDENKFCTPPLHKRRFPFPSQQTNSDVKKKLSPLSVERKRSGSFTGEIDGGDSNKDVNEGIDDEEDYEDTDIVKQTPQSDKKPRKISPGCESLKKSLF